METNVVFIICIVLLAIAVPCVIGYYFLKITKEFILNEQKKNILEIQKISESEVKKTVTPLQLQAYERLVLFLERMKADNLVSRCYTPDMSARLLKDVMVQNILDEYEHNLSQQLYVSTQAWLQIQNAKEDLINTLNSLSPKNEEKLSPTEFAGKLFELNLQGKNQIQSAQDFLKKEISERFN